MKLTYRGYTGSAEMSLEDNCLYGRIQHIDDVVTYEGNTPHELKSAFEAAVDHYLEHCERSGKQPDRPYSGSFNIRIGPERHKGLAKEAQHRGLSLNEVVVAALDQYLAGGSITGGMRKRYTSGEDTRMVAESAATYGKKKRG